MKLAIRCFLIGAWALTAGAAAAEPHAWLPPFGLERVGQGEAKFQADVDVQAQPPIHPVDLGAILPPHGWLLLAPHQKAAATVAALSREADEPDARVRVWYVSNPEQVETSAFPLDKGQRLQKVVSLPPPPTAGERDTLRLVIERADGAVLWQKEVSVMLVRQPPPWPRFGATRTRLRYDAPISVRGSDGTFSTLDYARAWPEPLDDVVVSLPDGGRFVFWRGASYIPFWASRHNTGLSYEWAETTPPQDGFADCVEPLMDKELRYGRVEIVESTAARVRVRWSYQSCDFLYKVWGDTAVEEFVFYPDGFGTRALTLQSAPDGNYELSEFILLTPQGAYPLEVLPPNLVEILFLDGERRELRFPFFAAEQGEKLRSRSLPAVFRVRLHRDEPRTAIYFHPTDLQLPSMPYAPFKDGDTIVTPCYWGSHWPLARGQTTGGAINDRIHASPAHNSVMTWAMQRPVPLRDAHLLTLDSLGCAKPMRVQTWSWLIGLTDADDARLLDLARSFSAPPAVPSLRGARLDDAPFVLERRALRIVAEARAVELTLAPRPVCVNPVLEIRDAPARLARVRIDNSELDAKHWAWDGHTLWLDATLRSEARLRLDFAE